MTVSDSGSEQQSGAGATLRAWRLARKELREILRDRRTVLTLILMPLLVYPLLGSAMSKGVLNSLSGAKTVTLKGDHIAEEFIGLVKDYVKSHYAPG